MSINIKQETVNRKTKNIDDTNQAFTPLVFGQDNSQNANNNSLQRGETDAT